MSTINTDENRAKVLGGIVELLETNYLGRGDPKVNEDTELLRDLGLSGDDVDEFFLDFARLFRIDLSDIASISIGLRFPGEASTFAVFKRRDYKPMTVRELVDFVVARQTKASDS